MRDGNKMEKKLNSVDAWNKKWQDLLQVRVNFKGVNPVLTVAQIILFLEEAIFESPLEILPVKNTSSKCKDCNSEMKLKSADWSGDFTAISYECINCETKWILLRRNFKKENENKTEIIIEDEFLT